jgi:hypothetical protein
MPGVMHSCGKAFRTKYQIIIVRSLYKVLKISAKIVKVAISKTIVEFFNRNGTILFFSLLTLKQRLL